MAQIFHRSSNTLSRITILAVLVLLAGAGWVMSQVASSVWETRATQAREQPIPFSHAHHVGAMGIDCRYCHTSVEKSSFAGIPPTATCMNCHPEIWRTSPTLEPVRESFRTGRSISWTRVNDLPDFVYFNHGIHISKGVGCETCHGRVDRMPLTWQEHSLQMEWCLNCHRHPEQYVRPREAVFTMGYQPPVPQEVLGPKLVAEYKIQDQRTLTSCNTCHR